MICSHFLPCRSLDTEESEEKELEREEEQEKEKQPLYKVLADYTALTRRELGLEEGDVVCVIKVGCAGWWYVRRLTDGCEGWAPSTYLQLLPGGTKTLERK